MFEGDSLFQHDSEILQGADVDVVHLVLPLPPRHPQLQHVVEGEAPLLQLRPQAAEQLVDLAAGGERSEWILVIHNTGRNERIVLRSRSQKYVIRRGPGLVLKLRICLLIGPFASFKWLVFNHSFGCWRFIQLEIHCVKPVLIRNRQI